MKFGHIEQNQLDALELSLPEDHSGTQQILKKHDKDQQIRVFTGCGKWGREEWVGNIFPEGTKPKDYLKEYINHFNSVELNSTFYSIKKSNLVSWAETANGKDFRFCPKFPRRISHIKRLNEVEDLTDYFVEYCLNFGNNLGPAFLQMPDNFAPKYLDKLAVYLEKIPDEFPMQIELRHQDWYKEPAFTEVHDLLQGLKKGFVITDTAGRRDVIHQRLTNPVAFIRFNGYGLHETDFQRMDDWAVRLKSWIDYGLKEIYFFAHQAEELDTPKTCAYFIQKINDACQLSLKEP